MIIWMLLQLRGRIFEPLGTDLTACFVHWHRELFVFCFCGVFWCYRSLKPVGEMQTATRAAPCRGRSVVEWTTAHQSRGAVPAARWEWEGKVRNGRKNPRLLGEHHAGVRTQEPGGFSVPGVLGNSLSYLRGKGASPRCCFKGQQLHSAFYELEETVELGKADCRHCFSLIHRIISSDYIFLVHFPLGCPD